MARNDFVIPSHTFFGHLVANSCLSRTYNIQVKIAIVWEVENR
ncbi:hypothetical protein [Sporosarcina sp. FSL K6-2383]